MGHDDSRTGGGRRPAGVVSRVGALAVIGVAGLGVIGGSELARARSSAGCAGGCVRVFVEQASSRLVFSGGYGYRAQLRAGGRSVVAAYGRSGVASPQLSAPAGRDEIVVTADPCRHGDCAAPTGQVTCRAQISLAHGQPMRALLVVRRGGCMIRPVAGLGPSIAVHVDRGVGQIRLGELSAAIARTYGPGRLHIHPATRTYFIDDQNVEAQFSHDERAINITATGPELTLDGRRLTRGLGYWAPRLRARHWTVFTCSGQTAAVSPRGTTSLAWTGGEPAVAVSRWRNSAGCGVP